jgi:hypothetical protein
VRLIVKDTSKILTSKIRDYPQSEKIIAFYPHMGLFYKTTVLEQHALKIENNCLNTNISSYLETSGGQSSNLYLKVVHFINTSVN